MGKPCKRVTSESSEDMPNTRNKNALWKGEKYGTGGNGIIRYNYKSYAKKFD